MNSKQRVILIMGAAAFVTVILTSPKVSIVKGTYITPPSDKKDVAKIVDIRTAITRGVAVLGATLLVSTAFRDKKTPRIPSSTDRDLAVDCRESEPSTFKKEAISKIIKFLKDFF